MKRIILSVMVCLPLFSQAQTNESLQLQLDSMKYQIKESGNELLKFRNKMLLGIGLEVGGTVLTGIGLDVESSPDGGGVPIIAAGGAFTLAGFILTVISYYHVANAGLYMQNNKLTYDLPIKHRKK